MESRNVFLALVLSIVVVSSAVVVNGAGMLNPPSAETAAAAEEEAGQHPMPARAVLANGDQSDASDQISEPMTGQQDDDQTDSNASQTPEASLEDIGNRVNTIFSRTYEPIPEATTVPLRQEGEGEEEPTTLAELARSLGIRGSEHLEAHILNPAAGVDDPDDMGFDEVHEADGTRSWSPSSSDRRHTTRAVRDNDDEQRQRQLTEQNDAEANNSVADAQEEEVPLAAPSREPSSTIKREAGWDLNQPLSNHGIFPVCTKHGNLTGSCKELIRCAPYYLGPGRMRFLNGALCEASHESPVLGICCPDVLPGTLGHETFAGRPGPIIRPECSKRVDCPPVPFRSFDGSCNNLAHPVWGVAKSPLDRVVDPEYPDGTWEPRRDKHGNTLPPPRLVRNRLLLPENNPNLGVTLSFMEWGQFIAHDIAFVGRTKLEKPNELCCPEGLGWQTSGIVQTPPECYPIVIPDDDHFYARHNHHCLAFVRSLSTKPMECGSPHRHQINLVSHFVDGSVIYGDTTKDSDALRTHFGGLMQHSVDPFQRVLMPLEEKDGSCTNRTANRFCYRAGDIRVNQQNLLVAVHTVFLRFHNDVAVRLNKMHPQWSDERLFQEARRFVVAVVQHITYNEWLPTLINYVDMHKFGLLPLTEGFADDYEPEIRPMIINSAVTAALRMGHSLVEGQISHIDEHGKVSTVLPLRDLFFKSFQFNDPHYLDSIIRTLSHTVLQRVDPFITRELMNHLFQTEGHPFGLDLASFNIQRGRDHGLPGYNAFRELCGLPVATRWEDFADVMPSFYIDVLRQIYSDPSDVDLYVAGIGERPDRGTLVGPTFKCIIVKQFQRLKRGDRFWYENANQPHSFTHDQLHSIRSMSLSRLFCDYSDRLVGLQPLVFRRPSKMNPIVRCNSPLIPHLNLGPWAIDTHP